MSNASSTNRRQDSRRPARRPGRRAGLLRPRRSPISPRSTPWSTLPIAVTVCRQEAGAAMMALTEGRLTGRPGICFVTRGPGATNAAHGVHIAEHDSAPMILFVGQVERAMLGRGAFQEMDYRAFFGSGRQMGDARSRARRRSPRSSSARSTSPCRGGRDRSSSRCPRTCWSRPRTVADAPRVDGDADLARAHADGRTAEDAVERRAADRDPRRAGLDRARERRLRPLRRAVRPAGRRVVPPRQRLRRRARELRRRDRPLRQPEAQGADREGRPRDAGRRPHVGSGRAGLYAVRHPRAAPATRPCPRRCARDRPQLSSRRWRSSPPRRNSAPRSKGVHPPPSIPWSAETRQARADYLAWSEQAPGQSRPGADERDHVRAAPPRSRRDLHHRRRQLRHLGRTLPALPPDRAAARADLGLDGLRPAGGDRRRRGSFRSARSSASPATAIS